MLKKIKKLHNSENFRNSVKRLIIGIIFLYFGFHFLFLGNFNSEEVTRQPEGFQENKILQLIQEEEKNVLETKVQITKASAELEELIEDDKTEIDPAEVKKETPKTVATSAKVAQVQPVKSSVLNRSYRRNNGTYITGNKIKEYVIGNPNGRKFYEAFKNEFGEEIGNKAVITIYYENGTLWEKTVGVCSSKYQIGGDYRNCNYADINSAGMDVGLKQINTFYQRDRIAKLGGPKCTHGNSRDRSDACNQKQIEWLHNLDNNLKISIDIYREQGFGPWYGAKRAGIV